MVQYIFIWFDRWFEPKYGSQDYRRGDYALLLLILAAGTWLRFWHLGGVGLHGDEDIMGLAARGIVEHGTPVLPSGMLYTRALMHTYLLAGSTMLLGDTEWALRLPSAIAGSLCGLLAFQLGRRFLDPKPNLAFVALIAFLPAMIDLSQTARMYVFLVAGLLAFGCLLFRWERTPAAVWLVLALLVWSLTAGFHALALFGLPLFLYPGLVNRSTRQLLQGAVAMPLGYYVFQGWDWIRDAAYPDPSDRMERPPEVAQEPLQLLLGGGWHLAPVIALVAAALALAFCLMRNGRWRQRLPAALLLSLSVAAIALLHYHAGAITLLFGAIAWFRGGGTADRRLAMVGALVGLIALTQVAVLYHVAALSAWKVAAALIGTPSVWPMIRFASFSPVGVAVLGAACALAALRLSQGRALPVYFLFFVMAVWAPLAAIGVFQWNVPSRYTVGILPFFLLSVVAAATYLDRELRLMARLQHRPAVAAIATVALLAAIVNPVAAWQMARNDYGNRPDHKGAAEYIRSVNPGPSDVLIAEDCISQTYYLGRVDYRLQNIVGAIPHSIYRDGILYGQYTGVPVIGSGRELQALLDSKQSGDVYIIGSGQFSPGLLQRNRANGIRDVLESGRLQLVYVGRDRRTMVWKMIPRNG